MDLIEQLGGHERAKRELELKEQKSVLQCCIAVTAEMIRDALLEYRRQHNIFEVGDWAVKTHPKNTILWPVLGVYKNGGVWLDYKGFCWKPPRVRHATDAEIEAGKRLEVNQ